MKPLSVGNVVSAGLRIYRDNFKKYYGLAFIAYLWIIVPIYGWAKFSAHNGLIARLAYGEIREQPESVKDARRYIKPRMWKFFGAAILVSLVGIIGIIIISTLMGVLGGIVGAIGSNALTLISTLVLILLFIFCMTWFFSRLLIYDLPLAIEENVGASESISRGWSLTQGSVFKVQLIFFIAFLISLPLSILINLLSLFLQGLLGYLVGINSSFASFLAPVLFLVSILIIFASGALLLPFWQAIKAVVYYDLLIRKEGLGLDLKS